MWKDDAALADILRAGRAVREFLAGAKRSTLDSSYEKLSAVIWQLLLIGEAATRLSDEARASFPDTPWKQIIGMRNRLIHAYDRINVDAVWTAAHDDLPGLVEQLERHLRDHPPEPMP